MLSVVLAFGGIGGPIAAADTDPDPSPAETHEAAEPATDVDHPEVESTPTTPAQPEGGTLPSLLGGGFDVGALFGTDQEEDVDPEDNTRVEGNEGSPELTGPMSLGTTVSESPPPATIADDNDNTGSDTVIPSANEVVSEPEVPEATVSHTPSTEPSTEPEAPAAVADPPAVDPPAEEPAAVPLVAEETAPVEVPSGQPEEAQLIGAAAPATDIVSALAYLFIALTDDSAPILSIPNDLLELLGFSSIGDGAAATVNAGGIGGGLLAASLYSAVRTQLTSPHALQAGLPEILRALGDPAAVSHPAAAAPPAVADVSATAVKEDSVSVALADSMVPEQVRSVLRHTVGAVLAPLSLLVLALMASPGLAGLVLLGAAGTFVGYRQAKAAAMLRAVGIGRFVQSGPLGVVTSGGLVALRSRGSHREHQHAGGTSSLESIA